MSATLEAALSYAQVGIRVLPVARGSKTPLVRQWPRAATTDAATIHEWWTRLPDPDVGIATGRGTVVIDVDPRNGGDVSGLALPPTVEALTGGGGRHLYFRHDGGVSKTMLGPGLDVQGDGAYVVAPPSRHKSGEGYEWLRDIRDTEMAVLPNAIADQLAASKRTPNARGSDSGPLIPRGVRNERLTSIAGHMRSQGLSPAAINDALQALRPHCEDSRTLPASEIAAIADSIGQYPAGTRRREPLRLVDHAADRAGAAGSRLTATHRMVLATFAARMDWRTGEVQMAWRQLEDAVGARKTALRSAVRDLQRLELVELLERGGDRDAHGGYVANRWKVNCSPWATVPDVEGSDSGPLTSTDRGAR